MLVNTAAPTDSTNEKQNQTKEENPVISPDGKHTAYLVQTNQPMISTGLGDALHNQIWLKSNSETDSILLIDSRNSENMEMVLGSINGLKFAPDGDYLYFKSNAWATSDAIHRVNIKTHEESFVTAGNTLDIVINGKFKGYLIVSKHKYYPQGGSYDDFWLLSPDGKEIKNLGDTMPDSEYPIR